MIQAPKEPESEDLRLHGTPEAFRRFEEDVILRYQQANPPVSLARLYAGNYDSAGDLFLRFHLLLGSRFRVQADPALRRDVLTISEMGRFLSKIVTV